MTRGTVVAEISVRRTDVGFGWSMTSHAAGDRVGVAGSASEAVWLAVDHLRSDDSPMRGVIAVYSTDGHSVAHAPLWAVPQYEHLDWQAHQAGVELP